MRYITKVQGDGISKRDIHIIEHNNQQYQIVESDKKFELLCVGINKQNFNVTHVDYSSGSHLATIVLAIEFSRFIKESVGE